MLQKTIVTLEKQFFQGISIKTNFTNETNPATGKISSTVQNYFSKNIPSQIPERAHPGKTVALYTGYISDYKGEYLFGIGEIVSGNAAHNDLTAIEIPGGRYLKFTTPSGQMPQVIINAWQEIWHMEDQGTLGGKRLYQVDFEVYDERALDPENTVVDIFLGIAD